MNEGEKKIIGMYGNTSAKLVEFEWCVACLWLNRYKSNPNREYLAGMMRERERSRK